MSSKVEFPVSKNSKGDWPKVAATLKELLDYDSETDRLGERLGNYAYLRTTEDQSNSQYQRMLGRFQNVATRAGEAASYIRPEILAIPDEKMKTFMASQEFGTLSFDARAADPVQTLHTGRKRRTAVGHAGRNGWRDVQNLPAVARFRLEIWIAGK